MDFRLFTIQRKGFLFKEYEIFEEGRLRYKVKGKPFSFLSHFSFLDHNDFEIMQIKRKFSLFKIIFQLTNYDKVIADIERKNAFKVTNLDIQSSYGDYNVVGNFWKTDFTITKEHREVARISRKKSLMSREYGIAIVSTEEPVLILGITMIIEILLRLLQRRKS